MIPSTITRLLRRHAPAPKELSRLSGLSYPTCARLSRNGYTGLINDGTLPHLKSAVRRLEAGEFKSVVRVAKPKAPKPEATPILVFSKNDKFLGVTEPKTIKDMPGVLVIKLDD